MSTIRDVSKLAGVSVATISRFLNQSGYVSKEAEETILAAIQKLNYKPNNIARSLAGKKTSTIALLVPDILNPFFPEIARAAEDAASRLGYTLILCNTDHNPDKERNYIDVLINKRIDGIIISSYTIRPEQIYALEAENIPVVVIDNAWHDTSIVSISTDNRAGGQMAAQHLLECGCRKIGHICGPYHIAAAKDRMLGYEDACSQQEWFTPSLMVYGDFSVSGGYHAMRELYDKHPDVDGVFAGNDLMAAGAMKALHELGVRIPDQMKVIGYDGIQMDMFSPALSTIAQPIYSIGELAMTYLDQMIKEKPLEKKSYPIDVQLIVNASSRLP
ncbi:transcriptional regulator [Paenibacillus selenitireducens]|uniref:Transcriptional regulator n=1 Tax=Paenibacillus selenitireducens TaxID=1324314 RepID=A0A1T2WZ93_9BACL|nr:LacI family DNA-binding transcriptional regulator [Paenibacillus selenitireducens]OPA72949.1 transcriptional regulator [Paenibacillus selenitireducens]